MGCVTDERLLDTRAGCGATVTERRKGPPGEGGPWFGSRMEALGSVSARASATPRTEPGGNYAQETPNDYRGRLGNDVGRVRRREYPCAAAVC